MITDSRSLWWRVPSPDEKVPTYLLSPSTETGDLSSQRSEVEWRDWLSNKDIKVLLSTFGSRHLQRPLCHLLVTLQSIHVPSCTYRECEDGIRTADDAHFTGEGDVTGEHSVHVDPRSENTNGVVETEIDTDPTCQVSGRNTKDGSHRPKVVYRI